MLSVSWFHSVGDIYWKDHCPNVLSLARGTSRKLELVDHSVVVGWCVTYIRRRQLISRFVCQDKNLNM